MQYNSGGGESLNGYNDYIYTYGSDAAYGYTQLPFWSGGRMRAMGFYADDTFRSARAHAERRRALRLQQGLLRRVPISRPQREPIGASEAVDNLFRLERLSPRLGATVK